MVKPTSTSNPLHNHIGQTYILAYQEATDLLEHTLQREGFQCQVLRQVHENDHHGFSRSYFALLNHRQAWEYAAQAQTLTLIVEADFVPVVGFGQLPLPFVPQGKQVGIAWLYTCAPQVYSVSQDGHAEGYSSSMVAYIITPESAKSLIDLAEEVRQTVGPVNYSSWDSSIDPFLRSRSFKNFIPFRNYGEHGGRPNPEHQQHGLSPVHRADVLYGKLAFLPLYATGIKPLSQAQPGSFRNQMRYLCTRSHARFKGLARLLTGRYLRFKVVRRSSVPAWLLSFAIRRHLSLRL